MKRQRWGLYAIALATLMVGLVWAGVPVSTLLVAALVLVCPLKMLFMHAGSGHRRHGGDPGGDRMIGRQHHTGPGREAHGRSVLRKDNLR